MKRKREKKLLKAKWSKKEEDIMIYYPSSPDGHWLANMFNKEFQNQLIIRGYDISTLIFSVERKG